MLPRLQRVLPREFFEAIKRIAHPEHLQKHPHLRRFFSTFDPKYMGHVLPMHPRFFNSHAVGRRLHFVVDDEFGYEIVCNQWMESLVRVDLNAGTVCKSMSPKYRDYGILDREIDWLTRLRDSGIIAELVSADAEHITTKYSGEPVSEFTLPDDWREQAEHILGVLAANGCAHNDISVPNVVVADGRLRLIDFAWALPLGSAVPADWPVELGRHRHGIHRFDDRFALYSALELIAARATAAQTGLKPPAPAAPPQR